MATAVDRYLMHYSGVTDGDTIVQMFGDLVDLWERAAAGGTPVRGIVGDDPVEFAGLLQRRPMSAGDGSTRSVNA